MADATASKSAVEDSVHVASNEYTSSEAVTFTVTASVADANLILTDDWGLTYYYAGSTKILDTGKISGLTENTQYAAVTISVTASVGEGKLIANALNTLVGKKFNVSFSDDVNYTKYQETPPTQTEVTSADKSGDANYTLIAAANTKDGTARYAKLANGDKTFAGGYVESTDETHTIVASSAAGNSETIYTAVYYLGLAGADDNGAQTSLATNEITITPVLSEIAGDSESIDFTN